MAEIRARFYPQRHMWEGLQNAGDAGARGLLAAGLGLPQSRPGPKLGGRKGRVPLRQR